MEGVTAKQFTDKVRKAFKATIWAALINGLPKLKTSDIKIVSVTDASRRASGVNVKFTVDTGSIQEGVSHQAMSTLKSFLGDTSTKGFMNQMNANVKAQGVTGFKVTGISDVTSSHALVKKSTDSSSTSFAGWKIALIVIGCLLFLGLIVGLVAFFVFGSKHHRIDRSGKKDVSQAERSPTSGYTPEGETPPSMGTASAQEVRSHVARV